MTRNARAWLAYLLIILGTWFYFGPLAIEVAFITLWVAMLIWQSRYDWRQPVPKPLRISKIVFMWCMMSIMGFILLMAGSSLIYLLVDVGNREITTTRMTAIVQAMHMYDAKTGKMPANSSKGGKSLLSWRVHLLPYLGEEMLYLQFGLDEPWDSPHNIALLPQIPECFQPSKYAMPLPIGHTIYQVFSGKDALMEEGQQHSLAKLKAADGLPETMLLTLGSTPVPWTKPQDIDLHECKLSDLRKLQLMPVVSLTDPLPGRRGVRDHQPYLIVTADGRMNHLHLWKNDVVLKPFITWNGKEKVPWAYDY